VNGRTHKRAAQHQGVSPLIEPSRGVSTNGEAYCDICQYAFPRSHHPRHLASSKHRTKESFLKYRSALDEAEKDKNCLSIDGPTDLGFVQPSGAPMGFRGLFVIRSSELQGKSVLAGVRLASTQGGRPVNSGLVDVLPLMVGHRLFTT